jgi:DNA-binding IclR family transcriptional regulator
MQDPNQRTGLQSVRRALRALELIAEVARLGVHKATASRLVATLAERGLVERDPVSEKYRLGFGLIRLAGAAMAGLDLVRTAHPILEDLADRTRETVNLGVLSGDSVVYIDQVAGARSIVAVSWVGRRTPLHCTSNGKVLLAYMNERERDGLLSKPLEQATEHTVIDPDEIRSQLGEIERRGYATTMEELEEGLNAVAAPIRSVDGEVAAALSVSGPAFRMRPIDLPRIGRLTIDAATAVSRRLGHVERRSAS